MHEQEDRLEARARRASAALRTEERRHLIPPTPGAERRRLPQTRRVVPALAGLLVVGVSIGSIVAGLMNDRSVVVPGVVASVSGGSRPVDVVTDGASVFVADEGPGAVTAYDKRTLKVRWTFRTAVRPTSLALGDSKVWVLDTSDNRVYALDPTDGRVIGTSRTSIGASAVTTTAGLVWVLAAPNRTIDKYDATTVTQIGSVTVPASARTLSASTDALWVAAAGEILKVSLDATRDAGVLTIPVPGDPVDAVADTHAAWVALRSGQVLQLDLSDLSTETSRHATDSTPTALTLLDDGSAVVATIAGSLRLISLTGEQTALTGPGSAMTAIASSGSFLVGVSPTTAQLYATEVRR